MEPSPAPAAPALTRECPGCDARCPATAQICYRCRKVLPPRTLWRFDDAEVADVRARVAAGDLPAVPSRRQQPGKFRKWTWIWLALVTATVALMATGSDAMAGLGMLFLIVGIPVTVMRLVTDFSAPTARRRFTAEDAAMTYFRAARWKRWDAAFACLSPLTREREVSTPEGERLRLDSPVAVRRYWARRRFTEVRVVRAEVDGAFARVLVLLRIKARRGRLGLGGKVVTTFFEVLAHQHADQWWLWGGELRLSEPGAPA